MTHHELKQKMSTISILGTCPCGRWSRLVLDCGQEAQIVLAVQYLAHVKKANAEEIAEAQLRAALS